MAWCIPCSALPCESERVEAAELVGVGIACVWLACGLAAVALPPTNRASWPLAVGGAAMLAARLAEHAVLAPARSDAAFALLRTGAEIGFLIMIAATVDALVRLPDGRPDRSW